jgi:putative endonuclease
MNNYYVYILSNDTGIIYVGVTNNLLRRMQEHKTGAIPGFTKKYHVHRLIYFEETTNIDDAIAREKQIKGWVRKKKLDLVRVINPKFEDLSADWFD